MYCPDCGEYPCVCKEEHPDSYYSDPFGEHEFHDGFDYESERPIVDAIDLSEL
ncbi:hypothetical protein DespoDRAFT_00091 [Desulfobacter postgatei 2ac9]|uniref:Uncharacterized protein n=1 Tax=Desulfobacter postgatei 2ac9 TaxID=879212 RepID=I5AY24_9BACT|nr:hypothetical protein DespoDRAFT_00091 [Desulfobacter postgatei 2ac9]